MNTLTEIHWNKAVEIHKQRVKQEQKEDQEYQIRLEDAYNYFMECIETDPGRELMYFEDAWTMFGVEQDELLNRIL